MFVCWWDLNWCGCFDVWMANEKNGGFGRNELDDDLRWVGVIIRCLLWFWMPFYVCNQVYKPWG